MKKDGKIRILVADDHFIVRMGLIALVNTEPGMVIVAGSGRRQPGGGPLSQTQAGPGL